LELGREREGSLLGAGEKMKKIVLAAAVAGALFAADRASAVENWVPYTDGSGLGAAAGALPPPGIYFQNTYFYASTKHHDNNGNYLFRI
jgi:hypothetical protein